MHRIVCHYLAEPPFLARGASKFWRGCELAYFCACVRRDITRQGKESANRYIDLREELEQEGIGIRITKEVAKHNVAGQQKAHTIKSCDPNPLLRGRWIYGFRFVQLSASTDPSCRIGHWCNGR